MNGKVVLILILCPIFAFSSKNLPKKDKFLSLFHIVTFQDFICPSALDSRNGTCLSAQKCTTNSGIPSGKCASGFDYPSMIKSSLTQCDYRIQAEMKNICSLRLDFDRFEVRGPPGRNELNGGACSLDTFVIQGTLGSVPVICGLNTGAHIYLDVNDNALKSGIELKFQFKGIGQRRWRILSSEIECNNPGRARPGCLQYYFESTGRINTFNFNAMGSSHLASQKYAICFRRNLNTCCIEYRVCEDEKEAFTLGISPNAASKTDNTCNEDFITIEGSSSECKRNKIILSNRYCGTNFNDSPLGLAIKCTDLWFVLIINCTEPFEIRIRTDETASVAMALTNRGLCLEYRSIECNLGGNPTRRGGVKGNRGKFERPFDGGMEEEGGEE
ncbi:unnamed protein product [Lepeophtheirus salmonis]|uniref:(salmon louse) hypothetical protein n=1 Tax=Lepeophtheirus salmonis TaxID=72036 RepID=A0A7R8CT66_LEPSM|nr:unnamed protein product [Lepeophtheirus salmonis]CAF2887709.1 unnamed protein product [Lepeophtheirus salmonis]